jgi:hypothetical protein
MSLDLLCQLQINRASFQIADLPLKKLNSILNEDPFVPLFAICFEQETLKVFYT